MSSGNGKQVYWGYCTHREAEGRWARGFVLASNRHDAIKKATRRVVRERRRFAKANGLASQPMVSRGTYRVRVWRDPKRTTAPQTARHYTERVAV
jgi:hypothetical protein